MGAEQSSDTVRVAVVWSRAPDFDDLFALRQLNPALARQPLDELRNRIESKRELVLGEFPRRKAEEIARKHQAWGLDVACDPQLR